jgi:outer membrane protein insertion porin family
MSAGGRYTLSSDKITLDKSQFYEDLNGDGKLECSPRLAGRYLCDEIGTHVSSVLGYTIAYDNTNGIHATRGQRVIFNQDFAGLGGDVKYIRTRADATKYWGFGGGWIFSAHGEGGYIQPLTSSPGPGRDPIRLTDRFFGPQLRGFDIRGIGPRIRKVNYKDDGTLDFENGRITDALGGRAYYMGRLELEVPVSSSLRGMGLRPSAFIDVGSLFLVKKPLLDDIGTVCLPNTGVTGGQINLAPGATCPGVGAAGQIATDDYARFNGSKDFFLGNSPKPRLSIGVGVNWTSPFGPLRLDIAKALLKQEGDDTKLFSFNVGTQF